MLDEELFADKCGVFGIWGHDSAAYLTYLGLHNLQHRGPERCGIVVRTKRRELKAHHGKGIVNDVFHDEQIRGLKGNAALGHARYKTRGKSSEENTQPLVRDDPYKIAVAHNGQFANCGLIKSRLRREGCIFTTTSDTELPLHQFMRSKAGNVEDRLRDSFKGLQPSWSMLFLTPNYLAAVRDTTGNRPLVMGVAGNGSIVFSSETVGLDAINAEYVREVSPGEAVIVDDNGMRSVQLFEPSERLACIFEPIYFARPDSFSFGANVTNSVVRMWWGDRLYQESPVDADVVIAVPDSSNDLAIGFAEAARRDGMNMPLQQGLIRSHYIGRTFLEPTQKLRGMAVDKKLNVNKSIVRKRRVIVVDDSIVRGNTTRRKIRAIRDAGATEVHLRIGSPPYRHPCYQGIDTTSRRELLASGRSIEEIRQSLECDSLAYLSMGGLLANPHLTCKDCRGYCTYCFDGKVNVPKNKLRR